jgi:hypothetical protein
MVEASVEIASDSPSSAVPGTLSVAIWVQVPPVLVKTNAAPWSLPLVPAAPGAAATKVWPSPDIATVWPNCSSACGLLGVSSAVWVAAAPAPVKTYTAPELSCSGEPTAVTAPLVEVAVDSPKRSPPAPSLGARVVGLVLAASAGTLATPVARMASAAAQALRRAR